MTEIDLSSQLLILFIVQDGLFPIGSETRGYGIIYGSSHP